MEPTAPSAASAPSATAPSSPAASQIWNADQYAANGRFVANLATGVLDLLAPRPTDRILDLGCGDGALTETLAATGAHVTGLDSSAPMLEAARARGLHVLQGDAASLPFHGEFSAVFSNAALHWIPASRQPATLAGVFRALAPGGRLIAEMGGQGNIAAIRTALSATLAPLGIDAEAAAQSFFPSPPQYRALLEAAGFTVHSIDLIPRPTPLPHGPDGLRSWLNTFRGGVLDRLPPKVRDTAVSRILDLLRPVLADPSGQWTADYVRLRFGATRPA